MGRGAKNNQSQAGHQPVRRVQASGSSLKRVIGPGYIELRNVGSSGTVLLLSDQPQAPGLSDTDALREVSEAKDKQIYPVILQAQDIAWEKRIAFGKLWNYLVRHHSVASVEQLITYLKDQGVTAQGIIGQRAKDRELSDTETRELISEMTFRLRIPIVEGKERDVNYRDRGFKLARSATEVNQYAASLQGRIDKMIGAFAGMKATLENEYWFGHDSKPQPDIHPYSAEQIGEVLNLLANETKNRDLCQRLMENIHPEDVSKPIQSEQELRKLINTLRREGIPIEGSSRGYRLSQSREELSNYLIRSQSRISAVIERKKAVLDAGSLWFVAERSDAFTSQARSEFERSQAEIRRDKYRSEARVQQTGQAKKKKTAAAAKRLATLTAAIGSTKPVERRNDEFLPPEGAGAFYRVKNGHGSREDIRLVSEYEACRSFVHTGRIPKGLKRTQRAEYSWLPPVKRKRP
jgi:hypothetical protein